MTERQRKRHRMAVVRVLSDMSNGRCDERRPLEVLTQSEDLAVIEVRSHG
jgi:hypothetical protein